MRLEFIFLIILSIGIRNAITNGGMMTSSVCDEEAGAGSWSRTTSAISGGTTAGQTAASAVVELGRRLLGAARAGDTRAVLELMSRGAPFTTDWLGTSPLHLAAQHAHTDTCAVLLRAGMSRDTRTKVERTPLHLAAYEGHAAVVELLLTHGALVDPRDMLRMTPLHWAAQRGHVDVAEVLLRHGADPRVRSKFGKTPLDLATDTELCMCFQRAALRPAPPPPPPNGEAQTRISQSSSVPEPGSPSPPPPARPSPQSDTSDADEPAARLLRRHGITLLPDDDAGTVLTALQSGRTVVLSDAGKLMLKDSETPAAISPAPGAVPASRAGVLLTATPVTSPPRPGVKIFTLPHKLVTTRRTPLTKVKYVQLPADAKIVPANNGDGTRRQAVLQLRSTGSAGSTTTSPIKLVLHKNGPGRPVSVSASAPVPSAAPVTASVANAQMQEGVDAAEVCRLRLELAASQATVARLRARLRRARAARMPPSASSTPSPSPSPERRPHPHPPD